MAWRDRFKDGWRGKKFWYWSKRPTQKRKEHIVVMGHSFVRRMIRDGYPPNALRLYRSTLSWVGHIDNTPLNLIREVVVNFDKIMSPLGKIDLMYFFLGSNDLASHWDETPETVADWLYNLGRNMMEKHGVKRVVFLECLCRFGRNAFRRADHFLNDTRFAKNKDVELWYAGRVKQFNARLQYWVKNDARCTYESMKGFHKDLSRKLVDGIHLDRRGRDKLRELLRRSMVVESLRSLSRR